MTDTCRHEMFKAECDVNRLQDSGRFLMDVRVQCADCTERFVFVGLPMGVNLDAPMVSVSGHEARLPIRPASEALPEWQGAMGFTVERREARDD